MSPRNADTPSLTESMLMVNEFLSDGRLDTVARIEKLEAMLSAVTSSATDQLSTNRTDASLNKYICTCQGDKIDSPQTGRQVVSVACQTVSTGDIVITRVFSSEEEKERVRLLNSPKK